MSDYHIPVLLHESIDKLVINPNGVYVDVTFGGGGHSQEILNRLSAKGRLMVFDQGFLSLRILDSCIVIGSGRSWIK